MAAAIVRAMIEIRRIAWRWHCNRCKERNDGGALCNRGNLARLFWGTAVALRTIPSAPRRPVHHGSPSAGQNHTKFRLDVRQKISNPPRSVSMPIYDWRSAGDEISVDPNGAANKGHKPAN